MLIGQDVEDLLLQLVSGHVVSVLGGADEVVAHFLLLPPVGGVLGAVGLEETVRRRVKRRQTTVREEKMACAQMQLMVMHLADKFSKLILIFVNEGNLERVATNHCRALTSLI